MIKAVIFDCFGVLVDPIFESFWGKVNEKIQQKIRDIDELADRGEIPDVAREKVVAQLLDESGLDGRQEIDDAYFSSKRRQDLLDFIKSSRTQFKTGLLSNVADNIDRIFTPAERAALFDDEVLSYQIHLTKPNPKIYRLAAQRLNIAPRECVFVDDKERNIAAAEAVGMCGILYKNFADFREKLNTILADDNHQNDNNRDAFFAKGGE